MALKLQLYLNDRLDSIETCPRRRKSHLMARGAGQPPLDAFVMAISSRLRAAFLFPSTARQGGRGLGIQVRPPSGRE
ncbi:hypothetical protein B7486_11590 [cyanobacterium TDX16]|nr:hypothetical protein B7486_11590 [cyanobacterium TDX16]